MNENDNVPVDCLPSVCILATYFGPLPPWFELWAASCEANPTVDFVVVSDQRVDELPSNVRLLTESLEDAKRRIETAVGETVSLNRPYKLCDYRPFFGEAYGDILEGYDYWGHSDLDMYFGDLRSYFNNLNLSAYDKFLPLGHLFLYRNTMEVNSRWRLPLGDVKIWRKVISSDDLFAFDERAINDIYVENGFSIYTGHPFADIATQRRRFILGKKYGNYPRQVFYWRNGKAGRYAFDHGELLDEEFLYVHFQKRSIPCEMVKANPGEPFYLGSGGFVSMNEMDVEQAFDLVNPYSPVGECIEGALLKARRKAGLIKRNMMHV